MIPEQRDEGVAVPSQQRAVAFRGDEPAGRHAIRTGIPESEITLPETVRQPGIEGLPAVHCRVRPYSAVAAQQLEPDEQRSLLYGDVGAIDVDVGQFDEVVHSLEVQAFDPPAGIV